jgi:hypothetical protein
LISRKEVIFVFGSNLAGRHGAGAALYAKRHLGAELGVGEGLTGLSYALPTKDEKLQTLPLSVILDHIRVLARFADQRSDLVFKVTPIGTGLAGYTRSQVASLFRQVALPANVVFSREWFQNQ